MAQIAQAPIAEAPIAEAHSLTPSVEAETSIGWLGSTLTISDLVVESSDLVTLLEHAADDERVDIVRRALQVGAKGLASMGLGLDLSSIEDTVRGLAKTMEHRVHEIVQASVGSLTGALDPGRATSLSAALLKEMGEVRTALLSGLDPDHPASAATSLVARIETLADPDGPLAARLAAMLDIDGPTAPLGRVKQQLLSEIGRLRDEVIADRSLAEGRRIEAERGTRQGFDYEDRVEEWLRAACHGLGGATVERTGDEIGELGARCKVGDFAVTLASGRRIVIEAKQTANISLRGSGGILEELDRAAANRNADFAICISGRDAFPAEAGRFWVDGTRLLVVDDGDDGVMTAVALRWAAATVDAGAAPDAAVDVTTLGDTIQQIKSLASRLSRMARTVTDISSNAGRLRDELGALRSDLLDEVRTAERTLQAG